MSTQTIPRRDGTFIVGFPGETEDDFEQLLAFLAEARIDRAGCFKYSPVEGARANRLADPVPDEVVQERYERFMAVQGAISAENLQARVGREMTVLVDEMSEDEDGVPVAVARSHADAPDIDGNVLLHAVEAPPGEFIEVLVDCPLEECERRDVKGLYQKARAGDIPEFTGISAPYEAPEKPDLVLKTAESTVDECVDQVLAYLTKRGVLRG